MIYFLLTLTAFGQSNTPAFQWQGVIRDASGTLFDNHTIQLKFSILKGSSTATSAEYTEIHSNIQTNAYGIAHVKVGRGTADTNLPATNLGEINWSTNVYFIKVELDTGSGTFMEMGATEILLPPFSYNHSFIIENDSLKITDANGTLSVSISELQQRTDSLKLVNNTLRLVASDTTYNVDLTYLNKITVFDFDTSTNVLRIIEANDTLLVDLGKLNTTTVNTIIATESLTVGEADTTLTDDTENIHQTLIGKIVPSGNSVYQTFTALNAGLLSKIIISINVDNVGDDFTLNIYEGEGIGNPVFSSQMVSNNTGFTPLLDTFFISNPIELIATQKYTYELVASNKSILIGYRNGNTYSDGSSNLTGTGITDPDLVFKVFVDVVTPSAIQVSADGTILKAPVEFKNDNNETIVSIQNGDSTVHIAGSIRTSSTFYTSKPFLYGYQNDGNDFNDDGFKFRYGSLFSSNIYKDYVIFEKNDPNDLNPDGGFAFTNRGSDGIEKIALTIAGNGNIGFGTNSPQTTLHIGDNSINGLTGTMGYRTWMTKGLLTSWDSDILFIGLKDEGSNRKDPVISWGDDISDKLRFFHNHWNGIDNEVMTLTYNGYVGFGTNLPQTKLHIDDGSTLGNGYRSWMGKGTLTTSETDHLFIGLKNESNVQNDAVISWGDDDFDKLRFIHNHYDGTDNGIFTLNSNGDATLAGNLTQSSDIRYKTNIKTIPNALERTLKLSGVNYIWKREKFPNKAFSKDKQIGVIAQMVEKVFPELVHTDEDGYKSVAYSKFTPILIEAIKEQQVQIEDLKTQVNDLQTLLQKNADLAQKLDALTKKVQALDQNKNASTVSKQ